MDGEQLKDTALWKSASVNIQAFPTWMLVSVRISSFFFMSESNIVIEISGKYGERKRLFRCIEKTVREKSLEVQAAVKSETKNNNSWNLSIVSCLPTIRMTACTMINGQSCEGREIKQSAIRSIFVGVHAYSMCLASLRCMLVSYQQCFTQWATIRRARSIYRGADIRLHRVLGIGYQRPIYIGYSPWRVVWTNVQ